MNEAAHSQWLTPLAQAIRGQKVLAALAASLPWGPELSVGEKPSNSHVCDARIPEERMANSGVDHQGKQEAQ